MFVKTVLFRFRRLPVRRHQLLSYFYRYWLKITTGRPNACHEKSSKRTGAGKSPKTPLQDSRQTTEHRKSQTKASSFYSISQLYAKLRPNYFS